jgi:hypothetical protein
VDEIVTRKESTPVVIRSDVEEGKLYGEYREELRFDFLYSCAYCTKTEMESSAVGFEIDHYIPQRLAPELLNRYSNLMWSCEFCNQSKWGYFPSEEELEKGISIVKADREDPTECYTVDQDTCLAREKDERGKYNIRLLRLNRKELLRIRKGRQKLAKDIEVVKRGLREIMRMNMDVLSKEQRIAIQKIKTRMIEDAKTVGKTMREYIIEQNRSVAIDTDMMERDEKKITKEYLRSKNAITGTIEKKYLEELL